MFLHFPAQTDSWLTQYRLWLIQVFREDKPARKVTVLGEVELISWVTVDDLSEDKKGGMLLKILEEGGQGPEGYKKPKDLCNCRVYYTVAAAVRPSPPDITTQFSRVISTRDQPWLRCNVL